MELKQTKVVEYLSAKKADLVVDDQFMSFSQNSISTPFKQVDSLIYADANSFSPV